MHGQNKHQVIGVPLYCVADYTKTRDPVS